jgi:hypothetical protein
LPGSATDDHEVVDGPVVWSAGGAYGQGGQRSHRPIAGPEAVERLEELVPRYRAQRAEAAARDAQDGRIARGRRAQRREHRSVAAQRNDQIAGLGLPGRGYLALHAVDLELHEVDSVPTGPEAERPQRLVHRPRRVNDHC